jgi:hypothetical protein
MGVCGCYYVGTGGVDAGMDGKGCLIDRLVSLNNLTLVINEKQVADADETEVHPEGIDPKAIAVFWIAGGDVSGDAFTKAEPSKQAKCSS